MPATTDVISPWLAWWRHAALAGAVAGVATSALHPAPDGSLACAAALSLALAFAALDLVRRPGSSRVSGRATALGFLLALGTIGAIVGSVVGSARIEAIDAGALPGRAGERVEIRGFVTAVPRRSYGEVRVQVDSSAGNVVAVAPEPVADLPVGSEVVAEGRLLEPDEFRAAELARAGARFELHARQIDLTGGSRGGVFGLLDRIRSRAEAALAEGVDPAQAELAKGFVLGQDDRIDSGTREEFRRSGLSHLLAVSGQNVALLAILAGVLLAPFGLRLRSRLLITILLIAVYVPVAGAGPSIQRAGVMGVAVIAATFAGRPASRAYPPLLAAAITLLIDPRSSGDVGWQLSFAAVVGIMFWAAPLRDLILDRLRGRFSDGLARAFADGVALTVAATIATAPLIAHDFERLSVTSLPANVLALPAVAPVMWLGMLIGLLGQFPGLPTSMPGQVEGVLLDYIAWVARSLGSPGWSEIGVSLPSSAVVMVVYLMASVGAALGLAWLRRHRGLRLRRGAGIAVALLAGAPAFTLLPFGSAAAPGPSPGVLRLTQLDVGQGDATLLQTPRGDPLLIDGGPVGGAAADALASRGIERLRAAFVSHDDLDHSGGLYEVLGRIDVDRLFRGRAAPRLEATARSLGTRVATVAEGSSMRFGRLRIDVLWPPRERIESPVSEPNADSLILAVRYGAYDALLTGDAEAEVTHIEPGPFDVLKVAHHGSDDASLPALLDRSVPRIALIGVGSDNPYGHPTEGTLRALAERGVCTLRTDIDGEITVHLGSGGVGAATEDGDVPADRPGCGTGGS